MTTRVEATRVLDHSQRRTIYELVVARPGVGFLDIVQHLRAMPEYASKVGFGSTEHHLQMLEKFRLITTRKSGHHRRHYESGGPWGTDTSALALLQTSRGRQIAQLLADHPDRCLLELWARIRVREPYTRQALAYHLNRFLQHGLAQMTPDHAAKRYRATARLLQLLPFATAAPDSAPLPSLPVPDRPTVVASSGAA